MIPIAHKVLSSSEFKKIDISYGVHRTPFGWCVLGLTKRGICHLAFMDSRSDKKAVSSILSNWPKANLTRDDIETGKYIQKIFSVKRHKQSLHLLVKGTNFQIKVWEALLSIPKGKTVSYKDIACAIGSKKAVRAVGTACGKNSIGFLIPCHRVLTSAGALGGYRWGVKRKKAILASELVKED